MEKLISIKYPHQLIENLSHASPINGMLSEIDSFVDAYCDDKKKKKETLMRTICKFMFTEEEKKQLGIMIDS